MLTDVRREAALDICIDQLIDGGDWQAVLPSELPIRDEVLALMPVAQGLNSLARRRVPLGRAQKERLWHRISHSRMGLVRRIAFRRLPYLPPLWIRPEAC